MNALETDDIDEYVKIAFVLFIIALELIKIEKKKNINKAILVIIVFLVIMSSRMFHLIVDYVTNTTNSFNILTITITRNLFS